MKKERFFWIAIFIIGFGLRSTELFHPIDRTEWRESDMASIARNYYRNGMDFFRPQIDWGGSGPGFTESEFPIYPYLIALSYKLFGILEPTGRIFSFLFSLGTMIVFFKLSKRLFNTRTAISVSFFFSATPLLMITSNSIQPESLMFFFYVTSAYVFIYWLESQSRKYYILTCVFTSLALLCKITAINIGILFALILIIKKGWRFLFRSNVLLLGILCVVPAIAWYIYSHKFFLQYGNSLGLSNEYAWIGWDFFINPHFIMGIIRQEILHVWTYAGLLIIILAMVTTKMIKKQTIIFPVCWLIAAGVFYLITARTSADNWAYYYHIFSVPAASMLIGISIIEIYEKYVPNISLKHYTLSRVFVKKRIAFSLLCLLALLYMTICVKYLIYTKPAIFKTSYLYGYKVSLSDKIPEGSLILATGGPCMDDDNYPVAYNSSYFFYWLDRKGFNICRDDQSMENVLKFKEKGADFYIAETRALDNILGFEEKLRNQFDVAFKSNDVILFKLNASPD
jgi:4-amino-4-deoxy-L-arabinose transferase-like glycosyltransferase